jgi:hypothetical protein
MGKRSEKSPLILKGPPQPERPINSNDLTNKFNTSPKWTSFFFQIAGAFPSTETRPAEQSSLGLALRSLQEELWLQDLKTNSPEDVTTADLPNSSPLHRRVFILFNDTSNSCSDYGTE